MVEKAWAMVEKAWAREVKHIRRLKNRISKLEAENNRLNEDIDEKNILLIDIHSVSCKFPSWWFARMNYANESDDPEPSMADNLNEIIETITSTKQQDNNG